MPHTKKSLIKNNQREALIDINELQKKAINMLKDVKKVLDKYALIYWLEGGTLLGYIRNKKMIHWANISHKYKRDLDDWIEMCVPCHKAYDKGRSDIKDNGLER